MTIDCIDSLLEQIDPHTDRIIVVDNASGIDEVNGLMEAITSRNIGTFTRIIASDTNGGFSAGNNIGIQSVSAEYYLLTNSDTVFRPDAVEQLLVATTHYPEAGLIGPRLEYENGEAQISCFRFPTVFSELIRSAQTGVVTRFFRRYDIPATAKKGMWSGWMSFASILMKSSLFREVGPMDDDFFMYFEDVDYCLRARRRGFGLLYWPDSRVVHLHGQSSGLPQLSKRAKRLPDYYYHSRSHFINKNYGRHRFLLINLGWILGRFISLVEEYFLKKKRIIPAFEHRSIWKIKIDGKQRKTALQHCQHHSL